MAQIKKGLAIVLSSPSGGGKSSIAKALLTDDPKFILSISATTRKPRPGDVNGVHYFFKTRDQFLKMINDNMLLEYAEIYGNLYGIPKDFIEEKLNAGKNILFDIDFQGAYKLKELLQDHVVSIFILPPSIDVLRSRLKKRDQDSNEEIEFRLDLAASEMEHAKNYDYSIVNEDFDATVKRVKEIIKNRSNEINKGIYK